MRSFTLSALVAGLLLASGSAGAQTAAAGPSSKPKPNHIFYELGGTAGEQSINYERRFPNNALFRVGYGTDYDEFGFCSGIGFISGCTGQRNARGGLGLVGYEKRLMKRTGPSRYSTELAAGVMAGTVESSEDNIFIGDGSSKTVTSDQILAAAVVVGIRREIGSHGLLRFAYTPVLSLTDAPLPKEGFHSRFGFSLGLIF